MKKFKISKCPECKKELKEVYESVYEKYFFNKKTGRYEEIDIGTMVIECVYCNADITHLFDEGVCNYQAERRIK